MPDNSKNLPKSTYSGAENEDPTEDLRSDTFGAETHSPVSGAASSSPGYERLTMANAAAARSTAGPAVLPPLLEISKAGHAQIAQEDPTEDLPESLAQSAASSTQHGAGSAKPGFETPPDSVHHLAQDYQRAVLPELK